MEFTDWINYEYEGELDNDYDYYLARQEYLSIFRPSLFYIGLNPRWQLYKFLPDGINVMYSAGGFWDEKMKQWRRQSYQKRFGLTWLDSGGYTLLNKYGDYPFSVINYANLVAKLRPNYYATMDYPCEPEISRNLGLMSNRDRIQATVKNAITLADWQSQIPGQMVPVIQGYELEEYLYCLDLYDKAGLISDYMAVGSMCRRISDEQLGELIPGIYYAAQKLGCYKLHFFGLKLSQSLELYTDMIYSRDSAVILDNYDKGLRDKMAGRRWPRGQAEKKMVFKSFLDRLDKLGLSYTYEA